MVEMVWKLTDQPRFKCWLGPVSKKKNVASVVLQAA
jgi:hypothetical protein